MKKKNEIKIYFCPKCKSTNVKYIFEFRNVFGMFPRQRCLKCGYQNMIFPMAVFDKNKLEIKKK